MSPEDSKKSCAGAVTLALFSGLAIGAVIGILFAPKSGKETRKELVEKGEKFVEMSRESLAEFVERTKDLTEAGKQKIEELKIVGEEIFITGKKKMQNTAKTVKDIVEESKAAAKKTEDYLS